MYTTRDAVLRIVKAERLAEEVSEVLRKLTSNGNGESIADHISGYLADALFILTTDKNEDNFEDTRTYHILKSGRSDEQATDEFMKMIDRFNVSVRPMTIDRKELERLQKQCPNGYVTPEGEWK